MRILQVCNVGNICGGTAACAWTISHALRECEHDIVFPSSPTDETLTAFEHCTLHVAARVDSGLLSRAAPDVVILHNIGADRLTAKIPAPVIQYHHSAGQRAEGDLHVACSVWLSEQLPNRPAVLYQPVPIPPRMPGHDTRSLDDEIRIGRICTPHFKKWPQEIVSFYDTISSNFPDVMWEFVGVPSEMKESLRGACRDRIRFHEPGFQARRHLWAWHAMLYHHPTLTETFGRTVAESMRARCIPIVDSRGGFCEQVITGESGYLCSNLDDFSRAIEAVQDISVRARVAASAFERSNLFSLTSFREQFRRLLSATSRD